MKPSSVCMTVTALTEVLQYTQNILYNIQGTIQYCTHRTYKIRYNTVLYIQDIPYVLLQCTLQYMQYILYNTYNTHSAMKMTAQDQ